MSEPRPFIPATITIDGTEVPIRIVRFDFESREAFARDYRKLEGIWRRQQALERLALVTAKLPTQAEKDEAVPEGNESDEAKAARLTRDEEKRRVHADNVSLALAMRELDETPVQRAHRADLDEENDRTAARITKETFERFVSVDPSYELIDSDGRPVQSGLDLLRSFPSQTLYASVLAEVMIRNTIAASLKKKLGSLSDSVPSSNAKSATSPAASGEAPVPTAPSVSTSDSADLVAATESR